MSEIPYETGSYYIFDRAYNKFSQLYSIHQIGAYFDVEKFYMHQIEELNRELAEKKREMCDIEVFLMAKYKAELGYCHQARVKTGIGIVIVKEIVGIINNASEAIKKYEGMVAPLEPKFKINKTLQINDLWRFSFCAIGPFRVFWSN